MAHLNAGADVRLGRMTAVMRAMTPRAGARVLRVGVMTGGRVVEERVVKQRTRVTIGTSEKAMLVVEARTVPESFTLFEVVGADYHLRFTDEMSGRVALASGIADLGALKSHAKKIDGAYRVKLTEEARGKIVVGDTTFLFQFVEPPPAQGRPQLPLAVKGSLATPIDWTLTVIAAFSFTLHFGLIGSLYSDWMDPIVDEGLDVGGLIALSKELPPLPIEEPSSVPEPTSVEHDAHARPPTPIRDGRRSIPSPNHVNEGTARSLASEANAIRMRVLGSFNAKSDLSVALDKSDLPPVDMSVAAASAASVTHAENDLHLTGDAIVRPGERSGIESVAGARAAANGGSGTLDPVQAPKSVATIGTLAPSAPVANLERVIAGLRRGFKSCYEQKGLAIDSSMAGKVTLRVKIAPNGEVKSVERVSNAGLSDAVVGCIEHKIGDAQFDPPGANGSVVEVPVAFAKQ